MTEQSNRGRSYIPPSDEQLENFVRALIAGEARRRGIGPVDADFAARMVMRNSTLKEAWLQRHRELQEGISHA